MSAIQLSHEETWLNDKINDLQRMLGGVEKKVKRADRDYFAAKAMEGILSNPESAQSIFESVENGETFEQAVAEVAYKQADAMIEASNAS